MKIDFTKIKLMDIEGKALPEIKVHKTIARSIYNFTENLDLVEIARTINKGKEVEIRDSERNEIIRIMKSKEAGLLAFVKKACLEFIENQKEKK